MTHLKHDATTGHLVFGSGGHLVNLCAPPCGNCSGSVPSVVQIAISGNTPCTCDYYRDDPDESLKVTSWSPSATYNLTASDTCVWTYTDTVNRASIEDYGGSTCSGSPFASATHDVVYTLTLTGSSWTLTVEAIGALGTVVLWEGAYVHGGSPLDCTADVTINSIRDSSVCAALTQCWTYGGSATVDMTP